MIRTPLMIISLIFFVSVTQSDAQAAFKCKQNMEKQNPIHNCKDKQCENKLNDELREAEKKLRRESDKFEKSIDEIGDVSGRALYIGRFQSDYHWLKNDWEDFVDRKIELYSEIVAKVYGVRGFQKRCLEKFFKLKLINQRLSDLENEMELLNDIYDEIKRQQQNDKK